MMFDYKKIFSDKKKALFVMAHPDDVDVFFGGTIARLVQDGKKVFVLVVTNGGMGSKDKDIRIDELAGKRKKEQMEALGHYGLGKNDFLTLDYFDGEVEDDMELIGKIVKIIRRFRPDIVCTHEPHNYYYYSEEHKRGFVNHRDHRKTGRAVIDAVYPFSRDRSFFRSQLKKGAKAHSVFELLISGGVSSNTVIDVTGVIEKKKKALLSHKSQFTKQIVDGIIGRRKDKNKFVEQCNYIRLAW